MLDMGPINEITGVLVAQIRRMARGSEEVKSVKRRL